MDLNIFVVGHAAKERRIAVCRQALIRVGEITVVARKTNRNARCGGRIDILRLLVPLLDRVGFKNVAIDIRAKLMKSAVVGF